jgi:hypothetical protein
MRKGKDGTFLINHLLTANTLISRGLDILHCDVDIDIDTDIDTGKILILDPG